MVALLLHCCKNIVGLIWAAVGGFCEFACSALCELEMEAPEDPRGTSGYEANKKMNEH